MNMSTRWAPSSFGSHDRSVLVDASRTEKLALGRILSVSVFLTENENEASFALEVRNKMSVLFV